jgi:protein-S-isoprenylcysteine O-methyltransferase Ste14
LMARGEKGKGANNDLKPNRLPNKPLSRDLESSVQLLRMIGKPDDRRSDMSLLGVEKTTTLVIVGAYRYIRHPLYSSLLFLAWGVFLKSPSWPGGSLAIAATAFLTATAKVEESENIRYFGSAYREYMKQTKMFIPFLF